MLNIALVVFREFMEVAVLLSIIIAATRKVSNAPYYIVLGMMSGVIAASFLAFATKYLTLSFGGIGDEIFDIVVILTTVLIISWTVIWMQGYDRKLKEDLTNIAEDVNSNPKYCWFIALIVASTIFREGSEIVLLIYSIVSAHAVPVVDFLMGLGFGAFAGMGTGIVMYKGLVKFSGRNLFRITSMLLILIAASLASEAGNMLVQVGLVDCCNYQVWDTSHIISDHSLLGRVLKILVGYNSKPLALQLIFYVATFVIVYSFSKLRRRAIKDKN